MKEGTPTGLLEEEGRVYQNLGLQKSPGRDTDSQVEAPPSLSGLVLTSRSALGQLAIALSWLGDCRTRQLLPELLQAHGAVGYRRSAIREGLGRMLGFMDLTGGVGGADDVRSSVLSDQPNPTGWAGHQHPCTWHFTPRYLHSSLFYRGRAVASVWNYFSFIYILTLFI